MLKPAVVNLIGAIVFLAVSAFLLVISGPVRQARWIAWTYRRGAENYRRHPWIVWIGPVSVAVLGSYLLCSGIVGSLRGGGGGYDVFGGLFCIFAALPMLISRKKREGAAKFYERVADWYSRNPWYVALGGVISGLIGVAMLISAIADLIN